MASSLQVMNKRLVLLNPVSLSLCLLTTYSILEILGEEKTEFSQRSSSRQVKLRACITTSSVTKWRSWWIKSSKIATPDRSKLVRVDAGWGHGQGARWWIRRSPVHQYLKGSSRCKLRPTWSTTLTMPFTTNYCIIQHLFPIQSNPIINSLIYHSNEKTPLINH